MTRKRYAVVVGMVLGYVAGRMLRHISVDVHVSRGVRDLFLRAGRSVPLAHRLRGSTLSPADAGEGSDDMLPYVCADCGRNYDWTDGAPQCCPHCGGSLIQTE